METTIKNLFTLAIFLVGSMAIALGQQSDTCRITVYKNGELVVDSIIVQDNTLSDDLKEMVREVTGKDVETGWDNIDDEMFTMEIGETPVIWNFDDMNGLSGELEDELKKVQESLQEIDFENIDDAFLKNFVFVHPFVAFPPNPPIHPGIHKNIKVIHLSDGEVEITEETEGEEHDVLIWNEDGSGNKQIIRLSEDSLLIIDDGNETKTWISNDQDSLVHVIIEQMNTNEFSKADSSVKQFNFKINTNEDTDNEDIKVILRKRNGGISILKLEGDSLVSIKKRGGPSHYSFKHSDKNIQIYTNGENDDKQVIVFESGDHSSDKLHMKKVRIDDAPLSKEEEKLLKGKLETGKDELKSVQIQFMLQDDSAKLLISFEAKKKADGLVQVLDSEGKTIFKEKLKSVEGTYTAEIKLNPATKDVYYINILHDKKSVIRKLIIE